MKTIKNFNDISFFIFGALPKFIIFWFVIGLDIHIAFKALLMFCCFDYLILSTVEYLELFKKETTNTLDLDLSRYKASPVILKSHKKEIENKCDDDLTRAWKAEALSTRINIFLQEDLSNTVTIVHILRALNNMDLNNVYYVNARGDIAFKKNESCMESFEIVAKVNLSQPLLAQPESVINDLYKLFFKQYD